MNIICVLVLFGHAFLYRLSICFDHIQLSLYMGVHPGCPVCLIIAVSLVAVETDVGEAISAA